MKKMSKQMLIVVSLNNQSATEMEPNTLLCYHQPIRWPTSIIMGIAKPTIDVIITSTLI